MQGSESWQEIVERSKAERTCYVYSFPEKVRYALASLGQVLKPKTHLIAGPFGGELGYELMHWQGYVRARRPRYQQVHVITYPGRDYLYENCRVHYHDIQLPTAGYQYGTLSPLRAAQMAAAKAKEMGLDDYDLFNTALLCTQYHRRLFWRQDFRLFEEPPLRAEPWDLAFHFRAVDKAGPDKAKNYRPALADELAARCAARGFTALCIGHPEYAYCAQGCDDRRSVDLRQTVAAVSSARVVVGENSGPMHLANLCGKPTILWAADSFRIDYSLRWNPFRVPIYIAASDTSQPEPGRVSDVIERSLADLKARTDGYRQPCYTLPAQPIAWY